MKLDCLCGRSPDLVFACSGAADVGELTDRIARDLTRRGLGGMSCLAGVGGHVPGIVHTASTAGRILALDGCPQDCAAKCLENAGITRFTHLRMTDIGYNKGRTIIDDAVVTEAAEESVRRWAATAARTEDGNHE